MKMLLIAKTGVFIMTGLIFVGLGLVIYKITDNAQKNKPQMQQSAFSLEQNEEITHLSDCAEYLCLLSKKSDKQHRLLMINPQTGRLHHQIILNNQ